MRTVMMKAQKFTKAPKIVVVAQTDTYGVVLLTYPLECKFFGGPCIDDCKRMFLKAVGRDDFGSILMCRANVLSNKDPHATPKAVELGYLYDPEMWVANNNRRMGRLFGGRIWIQGVYPHIEQSVEV